MASKKVTFQTSKQVGSGPAQQAVAYLSTFKKLQIVFIVIVFVTAIIMALFSFFRPHIRLNSAHDKNVFTYVGSEQCAACHQAQFNLWNQSQHAHAMAHADEKNIRGDFNNVEFEHMGVRSRFYRSGDKYLVDTDGPDGELGTFEIKYTFGIEPLQQYLIEFPDGRIQALSIAWDSRSKEDGGQRWFHLYPDEKIGPRDRLHWTQPNQNWNFMCAECHSTGVRKNYDPLSNTFKTTFSEISVGCETCHGQASKHFAWAQKKGGSSTENNNSESSFGLLIRFGERSQSAWRINPATGSGQRNSSPPNLRIEVETCGLCHSRRSQLSEDWKPGRWLSETHSVSVLSRDLFYPDGQMLDEVYNYTPFKQSKMFAAGVTCSDCHDPHSGKIRVSGDGLCLQCHSSEKFSTHSHHHHSNEQKLLTCVSCHMPVRNYMRIDPRHDHSFRIPRPETSLIINAPNACNDCHREQSAQWASDALRRWYGESRQALHSYGPVFHSAWSGQSGAESLLATIAADHTIPAVVRASALAEVGGTLSPALALLARAGLADIDPLVRMGALNMLEHAPASQIWSIASPALSDPVAGIRIRAAQLLAATPSTEQSPLDRERFEAAGQEFVAAQRLNADRPDSRAALGGFFAQRGQISEAEEELKAALRLDPAFTPAAINLADVYRLVGQDRNGEKILRDILSVIPNDASLHYALGLALVRLNELDMAISEFATSAELNPGDARYGYVLGVALHSADRLLEATAALSQNIIRHPADRMSYMALISFALQASDNASALRFTEAASRVFPNDEQFSGLLVRLKNR